MTEDLNVVDEGIGPLAVSSDGLFGPTFQGEGSSVGQYCYFLRLAGCNQHCVWCDTPYTWDWTGRNGVKYDPREQVRKYSVEAILEILKTKMRPKEQPSMLVISGGEPMLQQRKLMPLLEALDPRWKIQIETAGTIFPQPDFALYVQQFNVSPKLENSGNPLKTRYRGKVLDSLQESGRACWKFVVTSSDDLAEIKHIVKDHNLSPVFIMPEGRDEGTLQSHMQEVAQQVLDEGWNLTPRLQVEIWGDKRGV
jgi:7-cyano-7-deazaguanosine (preQ0) biosynthesis protein QueE